MSILNKYLLLTLVFVSMYGPWIEFKDIAPPHTNTYGSQSTMLLTVTALAFEY